MKIMQQISNYSKFPKNILTKRKGIGGCEISFLTQEYGETVHGKLPSKFKRVKIIK